MVSKLFAQFIKEKKYLGNLSQRTLDSYEKDVYKRWIRFIGDEMPTYENVKTFVIEMTEAGLFKFQKVKEAKRTMRAVPEKDMEKLLKWKPHPNDRVETRLYAFLCTLADTGMRIDECLTVELPSIYWDDFLILVMGKGKRERYVPMSLELRKILYQYVHKQRKTNVSLRWRGVTK